MTDAVFFGWSTVRIYHRKNVLLLLAWGDFLPSDGNATSDTPSEIPNHHAKSQNSKRHVNTPNFAIQKHRQRVGINEVNPKTIQNLCKPFLSHLPPVTWLDYPACLLLLGWRFWHLLMSCLLFLEGLDWLVLCHWKLRYSVYQASGPIMSEIEKTYHISKQW